MSNTVSLELTDEEWAQIVAALMVVGKTSTEYSVLALRIGGLVMADFKSADSEVDRG